jgi:hypothetical protein
MKTTTCGSGTFVTFRRGGERKTGHRSGGLPSGRGEARRGEGIICGAATIPVEPTSE